MLERDDLKSDATELVGEKLLSLVLLPLFLRRYNASLFISYIGSSSSKRLAVTVSSFYLVKN